jgi:hypothetical protein
MLIAVVRNGRRLGVEEKVFQLTTINDYWRQDDESQTIVCFGWWGDGFGCGSRGNGSSGSGFCTANISIADGDGCTECLEGDEG